MNRSEIVKQALNSKNPSNSSKTPDKTTNKAGKVASAIFLKKMSRK